MFECPMNYGSEITTEAEAVVVNLFIDPLG
jgi:hypothetical protein